MTPEEYLEWEKTQEIRHEYADGEVFAMSGASDAHQRIVSNVNSFLDAELAAGPCEPFLSGMKVRLAAISKFYYPDLFVTCDPRDRDNRLFKEHPKLIIEVLSPSTAAFDVHGKFEDYETLDSLEEYVLIDSERQSVERFWRGTGQVWTLRRYKDGDQVPFESLGLTISMSAIYSRVRFGAG